MNQITVVVPYQPKTSLRQCLRPLIDSPLVRRVIVIQSVRGRRPPALPKCEVLKAPSLYDGTTWNTLIEKIRTSHFLLIQNAGKIELGPRALERSLETAQSSGAGMVYADRWDFEERDRRYHPVTDCQLGSLRDTFDFGPVQLFALRAARDAVKRHGAIPGFRHAGVYDLRLKISLCAPLFHLPEALFSAREGMSVENPFAYVDPGQEAVQKEMEAALTAHLKRLDAWVGPPFRAAPPCRKHFPVEASVIIPVRNRAATIADAIRSALSQSVDFPFNVIVVDNHSTDGTTRVLSGLTRHSNVLHLTPARTDLGIGGCWNEALFSPLCGRWTVQLDSDDQYSGASSLQRIVDLLRQGRFAMAVGAYTLVNERLEEIPPGLVAHREWTDDNGPNNALRVNGFGAPRAFDTALARKIGFLNVSYGEDYAIGLRISREYRVGRIYDSLYFCRRWPGNTDAALSIEERNRNDAFKDTIRTLEILARQKKNREGSP